MAAIHERDDIRAQIQEHAKADFPNEACGMVVNVGKRSEVVRCANVAPEPDEFLRIAPERWQEAEDKGTIKLVYHSHPNAPAAITVADKACSEELQVPFLIYAWPSDMWDYYEPTGWEPDLVGRPFVMGVLDCYKAMTDWFKRKKDIDLPKLTRVEFWKQHDDEFIMANMEKAGFVIVDGPPREGDVLLMRLNEGPVNHIGVYLGDGMMFHHPAGHISRNVPYALGTSSFYVKHTDYIARHKSLLRKDETGRLPYDHELGKYAKK
jgi:proteasome lid subunit RPN8/RPN11